MTGRCERKEGSCYARKELCEEGKKEGRKEGRKDRRKEKKEGRKEGHYGREFM
jgi:hypothetical protein